MWRIEVVDARSLREAASLLRRHGARAHPLAGGGDLFPLLWKAGPDQGRLRPRVLVNLASIRGMGRIHYARGEGLSLGAMASVADIQSHRDVRDRYRGIAQAAAAVGSAEVRRTATLGGNLCQRPRCAYFRQREVLCLKDGGHTCWAVDGDHRYYHAILEGGPCHAVHPSDLAPALIAAGAMADLVGGGASRCLPLEQFFVTAQQDVLRENVLAPGELLVQVRVPDPAPGTRSAYVKARMDASWDFALAAAAVSLVMREEVVREARVVLGGVSPRPYRALDAERILRGRPLSLAAARAAAEAAVAGARPLRLNSYKVDLAGGLARRAILEAADGHLAALEPPGAPGTTGCCHAPGGPVRCRACPAAPRPQRQKAKGRRPESL
jgi:xanthine dehydrogenase YagS FAD-binding subunit